MLRRFWSRLTERASTPSGLAAALLLLPVVLAFLYEARDGKWRSVPHADEAVLQIHLRQAIRGLHLLGPYSQYDWYHPGPLYYYLLAPLYLVSGGATHSLFFSAGLIYASSLVGLVLVHFALDRRIGTRFTFLAVLAFTLAAFLARPPQGSFDANPITEIWNPLVTVVPFALAVVVAAAVAAGRLELAPLLALLQAFTAQTHVSYAPAATVLLFGALAVSARTTRGRPVRWRLRWTAITLAALMLLWLPPLIAAVSGQYGSFRDIAHFAFSRTRLKVSRGAAYAYAFRQIDWMVLHPFAFSPGVAAACGGVLSALQLTGAGVAFRGALRRREPYLAYLALAPAVMSLVALAQAPSLASLDEKLHYYQTLWYDIVGCFAWLGVALVACFAAERGLRDAKRPIVGLGYAAVACYALYAVRHVHDDFVLCRQRARSQDAPSPLLAKSVSALLERSVRGKHLAFNPVSANSWVTLATLVLDFSKRGVDLPINERWQFMYGNGARYAPLDSPAVEISADPVHHEPLWRAFGELKLYTDGVTQPVLPRPTAIEGDNVRGEPERILRDPVPADGEAWNGSGAVVLLDGSSSLTMRLPLSSVSALEIVADGNDDYTVEGSRDGAAFERVGGIFNVGRKGLAKRTATLERRGPWRALRIRAARGDGAYSVAHVRLVEAGFDCTLLASSGLRGDGSFLCDGEIAASGSPWDGPKCVKLAGPSSSVTVALPAVDAGAVISGVAIQSDGNDLYNVEASRDGSEFVKVGTTEGRFKFGMRWFPFFFNDFIAWKAVRLHPASGDGSLSLAEIRPIVSRGLVLDFGSEQARAFLRGGWGGRTIKGSERFVPMEDRAATLEVPLAANTDHELLFRVRAPERAAEVKLTVELNHHRLLETRLRPGNVQTISVVLPSHFVAENNELGFLIGATRPSDEARLLDRPPEFLGALIEPSML